MSRTVTLLALLALLALGTGCGSGLCTGMCSQQYSECVARAAPGAAQTDCAAREQHCAAQCRAKR